MDKKHSEFIGREFMSSVKEGNEQRAIKLIEAGACPDVIVSHDFNALNYALAGRLESLARALVRAGAAGVR